MLFTLCAISLFNDFSDDNVISCDAARSIAGGEVDGENSTCPIAPSFGPVSAAPVHLYATCWLSVRRKQRPSPSSEQGPVHDTRGTVGDEYLCDLAGDGEYFFDKSMETEVELALAELWMSTMSDEKGCAIRCRLCPRKSFFRVQGLQQHLRRKQLRVAMALFSVDQFAGRLPDKYIHQSAELLRSTVHPAPSSRFDLVDKQLRLSHSEHGPVCLAAAALRSSIVHRRVGNVCYDRHFAEGFLHQLMLTGARLDASLTALQMQYQLKGNDFVPLMMPTHAKKTIVVPRHGAVEERVIHTDGAPRELQVLAGDGTMKVCMGLKGHLRRLDGGGPIPAEQGGGAWNANTTYTVIYSVCTGRPCRVRGVPMSATRCAVSCIHKIAIMCAGSLCTTHRPRCHGCCASSSLTLLVWPWTQYISR